MTKFEPAILQGEIEKELENLRKLHIEIGQLLRAGEPSFVEVRAAGSILHDFIAAWRRFSRKSRPGLTVMSRPGMIGTCN